MNKWINKLITRHLEPEHNVRPLLGGIFHAAPEQAMPLTEEDVSLRGKVSLRGDETAQGDEERAPADEGKVLKGAGKVLGVSRSEEKGLGEKKVLKSEANIFRDEKKGAIGLGREETILRSEKKHAREESPVMDEGQRKFRDPAPERSMSPEPALVDDTGAVEVPGVRKESRVHVENRINYVTREAPVLQDLSEGVQGQQGVESGVVKNILPAAPAPQARQTIQVSIGRIEIKAVTPPAETKVSPVKKDKEIMGLDRYLEQRNPAKR